MTPDEHAHRGIDRRTLLKGAVAAGVGAAVYSAPVVSVVPAYGASTLVSFTVQSQVICVWFSPNQVGPGKGYGNWHGVSLNQAGTGFVSVNNNWDGTSTPSYANTGTNGINCWPPSLAIAVRPIGSTTVVWVTFSGYPDDFYASAVTNNPCPAGPYTYTQATSGTDWTGGGVKIQVWNSNCEMVVTGNAGVAPFTALGPYCINGNEGQVTSGSTKGSGSCGTTNDSGAGAPATWAEGSSLSPIGSPTSSTGAAPNGNVGGGVFKGTAYYHTNKHGWNWGDRCRASLVFQIRCRS